MFFACFWFLYIATKQMYINTCIYFQNLTTRFYNQLCLATICFCCCFIEWMRRLFTWRRNTLVLNVEKVIINHVKLPTFIINVWQKTPSWTSFWSQWPRYVNFVANKNFCSTIFFIKNETMTMFFLFYSLQILYKILLLKRMFTSGCKLL